MTTEVAFPDEVAALTLKAFASQVRDKPTDVVDLWRCLEVASVEIVLRPPQTGGEAEPVGPPPSG